MRVLNDMKIGIRLNVVLSSVMIVLFIVLGVYTIQTQSKKSKMEADLRLFEQLDDLSNALRNEIYLNQKSHFYEF